MSEKTSKLYAYINDTLDMIDKQYISREVGYKNIENVEPEITDKKEMCSYINYQNGYKLDYWTQFLFKNDNDKVDYLKSMCSSKYANKNVLEDLIKDFLKMPKKTREDFYKTNFVKIDTMEKHKIDFVTMCGEQFLLAEPDKIFHNLPTLYLASIGLRSEINMQLVEKINNDIMKVLKIDKSEFLDIYGNALIHCLDNSYIYQNWGNLEMNKRRDFQEAFSTKLTYRGVLKNDRFLSLVEDGHLPYDLKYPRGNRYLMSIVIKSKLDSVSFALKTHPFSKENLQKEMDSTKQFIIDVKSKYDLYFFNPKIIEEHNKTMSENFNTFQRGRDKDIKTEVEANMLKYLFEIADIVKNREVKIEKKLKI